MNRNWVKDIKIKLKGLNAPLKSIITPSKIMLITDIFVTIKRA